ncbi:hypothetical protein DK880_00722 [Candidatus Cardinium hertigii]|uniref:Uncharacterized protein n=2 Tax=Candidatus Cardinium hertigii TaxID=247481 RepID=A0A2Z3LD16_9BACT|nr:hypothetical protein DK880_00722 [Candidatus Cardinium hertigii]
MRRVSIHLSILRRYAMRSFQTTAISVVLLALWSCHRHNASMGAAIPLLQMDSNRKEVGKLNSTIGNQPIVEEVNIEYKLAKDLGGIVDLMALLPEARTPWENRLRIGAAVGTGLAAIGTTAAMAYYIYSWYVQESQTDKQTDNPQACFDRVHHAIEAYKDLYGSYVKKQRGLLYYATSDADTRTAMLGMVERSFTECSRHEVELSRCLSTAVPGTSYVHDASWITGLYGFSAAFGAAALGCFAGKEFFGRSSVENQQNRELMALKKRTLEAYGQIEKALGERARARATDLLHAKARADLKKFFAKASEVLCYLVERKQDLLFAKLENPIRHLAKYCQEHAASMPENQSYYEVLKVCSSHMNKVWNRITPEKSNTDIGMNDLRFHRETGDNASLASTSRMESDCNDAVVDSANV